MRRREGKMWFLPLLLFLLGLGILLYPTVHGAMVDWKMEHDSQNRDLLTLLTCHPPASGGKQRYLVICERIDA